MNNKLLSLFVFGMILLSMNLVLGVGTYPPVSNDMVLYYHFNNQSAYGENDTYVYDFSGNGNNGTANALFQPNTGIFNQGSFYFNGLTSINKIINHPILINISNGFTMSAWAKHNNLSSLTGDNNYIMFFQNISGTPNTVELSLRNTTATNQHIRFRFTINSTCDYTIQSTGIQVDDNKWRYYVGTFNGTALNLYVNGVLNASQTVSTTCQNAVNNYGITNISKFNIGSNSGVSSYFNGSIDEPIFYNKSLTATEVNNNYYDYGGWDGCIIPYDGMNIYGGNITFCSGTYYLNGSVNGVLNLLGSNISINGNGVNFIGNGTTNLRFINSYGNVFSNIYLNNFTINNYSREILMYGTNNLILSNINFYNFSKDAIRLSYTVEGNVPNNININNNNFNSIYLPISSQIYIEGNSGVYAENISVSNNIYSNNSRPLDFEYINNGHIFNENYNNIMFYPTEQGNRTINLFSTNNALLENLTLTNGLNLIQFLTGTNGTIRNSYFYNTSYFGSYFINFNGFNIENNTFDLNSFAIHIQNSSNGLIEDNLFNNSITNRDNWNFPLYIQGGVNRGRNNNITVFNNSFINFGAGGIGVMASDNINISSNYINPMSIGNMLSSSVKNTNAEPIFDIGLFELQETWVDDSGNPDWYLMNYTQISQYHSTNISISNSIYGSNTQNYLTSQGTINLSINDLPSNWYLSFQFPTFLMDKTELYNNLAFNNLSYINKSGQYSEDFYVGKTVNSGNYGNDLAFIGKYKISKNYLYFKNTNFSVGNYPIIYNTFKTYPFIINKQNLTNSLIIYDNGTTIPIYGTNQQVNLTLSPNQYVYVYTNNLGPQIQANTTNTITTWGQNETINFLINSSQLDSCWYNYNNLNTPFTCLDSIPGSFNFTTVLNLNTITLYANDTSNNINSTTLTIQTKIPQPVGQLTIDMIKLVTGILAFALIIVFTLVMLWVFTQRTEGFALASFIYLLLYFIIGIVLIGVLATYMQNWLLGVIA